MTDADRIAALEAENAALRAELASQHAEILSLSIYAPGRNVAQPIRMAPHVGPTNWAAWGIEPPIDAEQ